MSDLRSIPHPDAADDAITKIAQRTADILGALFESDPESLALFADYPLDAVGGITVGDLVALDRGSHAADSASLESTPRSPDAFPLVFRVTPTAR